jgi:uncharacterized coiled-coil protein SlyX
VVDLEWNRKSLYEKLDWLKEAIEDLVAKANHNISVQQEQLRAVTARLSALEKRATKSTPPAKPPAEKRRRGPPRSNRRPLASKGKR